MNLIEKLEQLESSLTQDFMSKDVKFPYEYSAGKLNGVREAIDIVKQHQAESGWVSVDDRLPSDGDIVEVYRDSYKWGDLVWQCLYTKARGFRNYPVDSIGKNEKITHWRAIQPPSEV